jgi:hypothetical protein
MTEPERPTAPDPIGNPGGDGEVIGEDEAKQGRVGLPIVVVLIVSIVLVVVAFGVIYLRNAHRTTDAAPATATAPNR